jgi:hypothetical protein
MAKQRQAAKDRRKQPRMSLSPQRTGPLVPTGTTQVPPYSTSLRMTLPTQPSPNQPRAGVRMTLPNSGLPTGLQSTTLPFSQIRPAQPQAASLSLQHPLPLLGRAVDSYSRVVPSVSMTQTYSPYAGYQPQPYSGPRAGYQMQPRAGYQPHVPTRYSTMPSSIYQPPANYAAAAAARASYGHNYTTPQHAAQSFLSTTSKGGSNPSKDLLPSYPTYAPGGQSTRLLPTYSSTGTGSALEQPPRQAGQPAVAAAAMGTSAAITTNGAGHPHPT